MSLIVEFIYSLIESCSELTIWERDIRSRDQFGDHAKSLTNGETPSVGARCTDLHRSELLLQASHVPRACGLLSLRQCMLAVLLLTQQTLSAIAKPINCWYY